jgi:hypothetical protein
MPPPGRHSPAQSLPGDAHPPCTISALQATPPRLAQLCKISALPVHAPKACHARDTNMQNLCSTGPQPQGWHSPVQYSLHKPVPLRPAKPGTHTCTISVLMDHAPQACQAGDPRTCRISTPPAYALQAHQAHAPKACHFTSAKGRHP